MRFQDSLYVLVALVAATFAITITDAKNDLQSLNTQSLVLDDAIKQLPDSDTARPEDVSAIQIDITNLTVALDQAASRVKDLTEPIPEIDAIIMLTNLQSLRSAIKFAFMAVVDTPLLFVVGLPRAVQNLQSSTSGYEDALKAKVPANLSDNF